MTSRAGGTIALAMLLATLPATGAAAQDQSVPATPTPAPTPSATTVTVPSTLDSYSLPAGPNRIIPTPTPTPTPKVVAPPLVVLTRPSPAPTPEPSPRRPIPRPTPSPTTSPEPAPSASPAPLASLPPPPAGTIAATPTPVANAGTIAPSRRATPLWPWLVGAAALMLGIGIGLARRRRADVANEVEAASPTVAPPPPAVDAPIVPTTAPAVPADTGPRAVVEIELIPRRAGLNLLSATVDSELVLRNTGVLAAEGVSVEIRLLGTRAAQPAALTALFAGLPGRPATAPFTLAPGEERRLRAISALPHDALDPLTADGRELFVPVIAVDVRYRWGDREGQAAASFVVGIRREGRDKLAPFWLDAPPRTYDAVAARQHVPPLVR